MPFFILSTSHLLGKKLQPSTMLLPKATQKKKGQQTIIGSSEVHNRKPKIPQKPKTQQQQKPKNNFWIDPQESTKPKTENRKPKTEICKTENRKPKSAKPKTENREEEPRQVPFSISQLNSLSPTTK